MWLKKISLGILIGVLLCSVQVSAKQRREFFERPVEERIDATENIYGIPRRIYGRKRNTNKVRRIPDKFCLPPDAKIGDIIKTEDGYNKIVDIWRNGQFRMKSLNRKKKIEVKKRYNQKIRNNKSKIKK